MDYTARDALLFLFGQSVFTNEIGFVQLDRPIEASLKWRNAITEFVAIEREACFKAQTVSRT